MPAPSNSAPEQLLFFKEDFRAALDRSLPLEAALLAYYRRAFPPRVPGFSASWEYMLDENVSSAQAVMENKVSIAGELVEVGYPVNWRLAPGGDLEFTCFLARHHNIIALARAYAATGEERYLQRALAMLEDWIDKVPPFPPVLNDESYRDIYAGESYFKIKASHWRPLEIAHRVFAAWNRVLALTLNSRLWTPRLFVKVLASIHEQLRRLHLTRWKTSNHAVGENAGLIIGALQFPEFKLADTWQQDGLAELRRLLNEEVFADGFSREASGWYHWYLAAFCAELYFAAAQINRPDLFDRDLLARLHQYYRANMWQTNPDGSCPAINDSDHFRDQRRILAEGAAIFKDAALRYVATGAKEGTAPERASFLAPDAGFGFLRSGWEPQAHCLFFAGGAAGHTAHSQPARLCVEVYGFGRKLLANAGRYRYSTSPSPEIVRWSDYFRRSSRAANTVDVDGISQNPRKDAQGAQYKSGDGWEYLAATYAGGYGDISATHQREIIFARKAYWIIRDTLTGKGIRTVRQHWHTPPGAFCLAGQEFEYQPEPGIGILVKCLSPDGQARMLLGCENPIGGWFSRSYGRKEPAPEIAFTFSRELPMVIYTLLVPWQESKPAVSGTIARVKGKTCVLANIAGRADRICFDPVALAGPGSARAGGLPGVAGGVAKKCK